MGRFLMLLAPLLLPNLSGDIQRHILPKIIVTPNIWGGASVSNIELILQSTARQIWPYAEQSSLCTIQVDRSRTGPIVLYRRGSNGEYLVHLDTQKQYWCQYAFQFAHELCHIICGYKKGDRSNLWFEESLCETASLFVLRKMTEEWKIKPSFPNWKPYGVEFAKYAQNRLNRYTWPDNLPLAQWYAQKKHTLNEDPTNRPRNVQLASQLLQYFEKDPSLWATCSFINHKKTDQEVDFSTYLLDWKDNCQTSQQKGFVQQLILSFGLDV
jgi:hypothetical protein